MPLLLIHLPDKPGLRRQARARRRGMDVPSRDRAEHAIAAVLEHRRQHAGWRRIAAYAGTASEARLSPWFDRLEGDVELSLPAIDEHGVMTFRRWRPGIDLVPGPFAIEQPPASADAVVLSCLDVVLMPLLGFDNAGTRLGSGAGYYDRALAFRAARAATPMLVGVAFAVQEFAQLPRDPWDIPLDAIVTEHGWFDIARR